MAAVSPTLFSRSLSRRRPGWQTVLVCLALFAVPLLAAAGDGMLHQLAGNPLLRPMLLPPVILSYILLTAPLLSRGELDLVRRLQPVVRVSDERYAEVVAGASRINPAAEVAAVLAGALAGYAISRGWGLGEGTWLRAYLTAALPLMFGVLAWTIYDSLASTKLLAALHEQPMAVDLLDISPFEPIGRQSLLSTLVFLGGILLGILFGLDLADLALWRTWIAYGPLAGVVLVLFFLSMRNTHRVLAAARARELALIQERLRPERERLRQALQAGTEMPAEASASLAALLAYEQRIRAAPTWPYNTTMLRTLLFSILLPLALKAVTWLLFER